MVFVAIILYFNVTVRIFTKLVTTWLFTYVSHFLDLLICVYAFILKLHEWQSWLIFLLICCMCFDLPQIMKPCFWKFNCFLRINARTNDFCLLFMMHKCLEVTKMLLRCWITIHKNVFLRKSWRQRRRKCWRWLFVTRWTYGKLFYSILCRILPCKLLSLL